MHARVQPSLNHKNNMRCCNHESACFVTKGKQHLQLVSSYHESDTFSDINSHASCQIKIKAHEPRTGCKEHSVLQQQSHLTCKQHVQKRVCKTQTSTSGTTSVFATLNLPALSRKESSHILMPASQPASQHRWFIITFSS